MEAAFGLFAYLVPLPGKLGLEHARKATVLFGNVPGRVAGTLGISPDFTGAILMVTLLVTLGLAASPRTPHRAWWFAAVVLQLVTLGLTFSRAPLGLAIVGVAAVILLSNRPILLVPLAGAGAVVAVFTPLVERFLSDSNDRLALWTAAWRVMLDHPIAGVGAGQMLATLRAHPTKYMHTSAGLATNNAHNTILLAGAELGVVAAIGALILNVALVVMTVLTVRDGVRREPRDSLEIAAGIAVLGFLVQGMVNNLFTVGATSVVVALVAGAFLWQRTAAPAMAASAAPAPSISPAAS
jgi:O-antigen ligase